MTLYWIRNIKSIRPSVVAWSGNHTEVNEAAREVFNGRHAAYYPGQPRKFDPKNDVLLHSEESVKLLPFNHDELQEESED